MKCKRQFDGRKLDRHALEALRVRTVQQILDGQSPEVLAKTLDMNPAMLYKWLAKYHYGDMEALKVKRQPGRPSKLSGEQMQWLANTVRENNPLQLQFLYALWTSAMIRELIRERFHVRLSEVSVGPIMRRLGFTPQSPVQRAYQLDPVLVERWRAEDYPQIQRQARKDNALIFFADESGIRSNYHKGHTWATQGKTPVVEAAGARFAMNMLSAVSAQRQFRFMVHEGTATAQTFCEFLRRLADGVDQKIYLIVDGHRIHRARKAQRLLAQMGGKITLFFLPPYSPRLIPDELVWAQVKPRVGKQMVTSKDELTQRVISALRSLQKLPEKIKGFFRTPSCQYAVHKSLHCVFTYVLVVARAEVMSGLTKESARSLHIGPSWTAKCVRYMESTRSGFSFILGCFGILAARVVLGISEATLMFYPKLRKRSRGLSTHTLSLKDSADGRRLERRFYCALKAILAGCFYE